jgi:hypothetical protein
MTTTMVNGCDGALEFNLVRVTACLGDGVMVGAATRSAGLLRSLQPCQARGRWASRASGWAREPTSLDAEEWESTNIHEFPILNLCFCMFASR